MSVKHKIKDVFVYCISLCLTKKIRELLCHKRYFKVWENLGIHITPVHYYQPILDRAVSGAGFFVAFNGIFKVLWGSSFMHVYHPAKLEAVFSSYRRDLRRPGSLWLRKVQ